MKSLYDIIVEKGIDNIIDEEYYITACEVISLGEVINIKPVKVKIKQNSSKKNNVLKNISVEKPLIYIDIIVNNLCVGNLLGRLYSKDKVKELILNGEYYTSGLSEYCKERDLNNILSRMYELVTDDGKLTRVNHRYITYFSSLEDCENYYNIIQEKALIKLDSIKNEKTLDLDNLYYDTKQKLIGHEEELTERKSSITEEQAKILAQLFNEEILPYIKDNEDSFDKLYKSVVDTGKSIKNKLGD